MCEKRKLPELIVQVVLLFVGAIIALTSSQFTQYWQNYEEISETKKLIIGCIQDDVDRIEKEIVFYHSTYNNPKIKKIDARTFLWQHESVFFQNIASKSGVLDVESIKNINGYINTIYQSRSSRNILHDALIKSNNDKKKVEMELRLYLSTIGVQFEIGKQIIEDLNQ